MKKIMCMVLCAALSAGAVAQKGKKSGDGNTASVSSTTKSENANLDRAAMVDAKQHGYEKQFRHRTFKRGTPMGECPGNPHNKLNRNNPYKKERKHEKYRKPTKKK